MVGPFLYIIGEKLIANPRRVRRKPTRSISLHVNMALMTCRGKVDCWCSTCHQQRFDRIKDLNLGLPRLLVKFEGHEQRESKTLERVFAEVLNATVYATLVKEAIFRTTGLKKTKTYLSLMYPRRLDKELSELADSINHAALVYTSKVFLQLATNKRK